MSRRISTTLCVAVLAAATIFSWLGSRGLSEPDEGRFAEIAREMAMQGDWLVPHLNGVEHFQKPPFIYWLTALSISAFGVNEWAARTPPALAATGTVWLTMYIAGLLFGPACRWRAGFILLSCIEFFVLAHVLTTDMLLTFWITASVAGLVVYQRKGTRWGLFAYYACMGAGFLTKGPMAFLIPMAAGIAWQVATRRMGRTRLRMGWWWGVPFALLLGLSWHLILVYRHESLYDYFVKYEFIDRLSSNVHKRYKPFWYFGPILLGGFFPWTLLLPAFAREVFAERAWRTRPEFWLFAGWILLPLGVLSCVSSKLVTYVLPLFAPMSIALAAWWVQRAKDPWREAGIRVASLILALGIVAIPWIVNFSERKYHRDIVLSPLFPIAMILVLAVLAASWLPRRRYWTSLWFPGGCMLAVMLTLMANADSLLLGGNAAVHGFAEHIRARPDHATIPVFACDVRFNGLEFRLNRLIERTQSSSDVVLPLTPDQSQRIMLDVTQRVQELSMIPSFVVAKATRSTNDPIFVGWQKVDAAGSSVLMQSPAIVQP